MPEISVIIFLAHITHPYSPLLPHNGDWPLITHLKSGEAPVLQPTKSPAKTSAYHNINKPFAFSSQQLSVCFITV